MTANGATESGFGSSVDLFNSATADHATIVANGGIFPGQSTSKGAIDFEEDSTAAEATLIINPTSVTDAVGGSCAFGSGASAFRPSALCKAIHKRRLTTDGDADTYDHRPTDRQAQERRS